MIGTENLSKEQNARNAQNSLLPVRTLPRNRFRSAVERDYPIIFGTLFAFGLIGLVVGILSDLMYVFVDPRIDFERRA